MGALFEKPEVHATVDRLLQAVVDQSLTVVIDQTFSLQDAASAHEYAEEAKPFGSGGDETLMPRYRYLAPGHSRCDVMKLATTPPYSKVGKSRGRASAKA